MMSEHKLTNYSVPVIFEPPCISHNVSKAYFIASKILLLTRSCCFFQTILGPSSCETNTKYKTVLVVPDDGPVMG